MADAEQYQYTESGLRNLKQQELDLQQAEIAGRWLLVEYERSEKSALGVGTGESKPQNDATFEKTTDPNAPGKIVLVEVADESKLKAVKAEQKAQGREFVLYSIVYVSGAEANVAVFR